MGEGQWREGGGRRQFGLKGKRGGTREGGRERLGTGTLFHLAKFVSNEYKKKINFNQPRSSGTKQYSFGRRMMEINASDFIFVLNSPNSGRMLYFIIKY